MEKLLGLGSLATFLVILAVMNFRSGEFEFVKVGVIGGMKFFVGLIPLLILFSLLYGQIQVFYKEKPALIRKMITETPWKAALGGAILPGGAAMGKVIRDDWKNGGNKFAIIAFLVSLSLINWSTLLFRLPFFGWNVTIAIFTVGFIITGVSVSILILLQHLRI